MSKTITIPSDRGSRVIVEINGVQYIYAAGSTVTVPDAVAACIADSEAMKPGGYRESGFDEAHVGLEARVEALEAGGGGSSLPEVSATDNGDVLTVVEGAWAKAEPSGGVLMCTMDLTTGALNKTWQQIHDNMPAYMLSVTDGGVGCFQITQAWEEGGEYGCIFTTAEGEAVQLTTDSASGYPAFQAGD